MDLFCVIIMNKEKNVSESMLESIIRDIEENKEEIIEGLSLLIETCSSDGKATESQSIVERFLSELGMQVDTFKGIDSRSMNLDDFCQPDIVYDENAYNVAGKLKGNGNVPSLMLFGHIDTEAEDYFGRFDNPYQSYRKDNKIYGLGASDDKGGIAMMLYALKYVLKYQKSLPYDLTVLSILGKHGGGYGTLSALMKGYTAENSIYLHPAETGHGFAEIKNISLGVVDLVIRVKGKMGEMHDDLATGFNSNVIAAGLIRKLDCLNKNNREKYRFDFGTFKGKPSYVLNVGSVSSDYGFGGIALNTIIKLRIRFFMSLTMQKVIEQVNDSIITYCNEENLETNLIELEIGNFKATPAMIDNDHPYRKSVRHYCI